MYLGGKIKADYASGIAHQGKCVLRGGAVTEPGDKRGDVTRQRLLRAAARQFAEKSYSLVNLDDIIAEANATKGSMYFHFQSKKALAMTLIHAQNSLGMAAANDVLAKQL